MSRYNSFEDQRLDAKFLALERRIRSLESLPSPATLIAQVLLTLQAPTINLNATTEVQIKGTRAYLLTQGQTALGSGLSPIPNTFTDVPSCTVTLPTVTTNAKYLALLSANIGMNPPGLTIVQVRLQVNGAAQTQIVEAHMHETQRDNQPQFWFGNLATASASNVFKIQAQDTLNSGVCDIEANNSTLTVLIFESGGP